MGRDKGIRCSAARIINHKVKGAGDLAELIALDSEKFGPAYIDAMVVGHSEALAMTDGDFLEKAENEAVTKHLGEVRGHISMHLGSAKEIQNMNHELEAK